MDLSKLLEKLPAVSHPNLLVSLNTADDAGVYKLTEDIAIVNTVDIFTPVVDDLYAFGQITAANALSDIYAMGGKPISALNIVGYPKKHLSLDELAVILKGAIDKTREADCPIIGGHTIRDDVLKYGLAVTGIIHPEHIISNANAKPGDKLILTKPLGIGIMTLALKAGHLSEQEIQKVTSVMTQLNKTSAETMVSFNAHAATDITGFGLLGHALEMVNASNISMILDADKIPCLPEAIIKSKKREYISDQTINNKIFLEKKITFTNNVSELEQMILYDTQTSGGLLISIDSENAYECLNSLHEKGVTDAAIIGEVIPPEKVKIKIIKEK